MKIVPAICVLLVSLVSQAQTFKYVSINFPNAKSTTANGINNSGTIVGSYVSASGHNHGYRLQNAHFATIDFPNSASTVVNGINDLGDMVGTYLLAGSQLTHGFIRFHTGTFKKLNAPKATFGTTAMGINKALTVVGGFFSDSQHGYIFKNGVFTIFDAPTNANAPDTILNGISNLGEIVGQDFSGDNWRGFLKIGTDLDFLAPLFVPDNMVFGVNGRGDLVGCHDGGQGFFVPTAETSEGSESTEKFPATKSIQFQSFLNTCPHSINYVRSIVGSYLDGKFVSHGFLAIAQ